MVLSNKVRTFQAPTFNTVVFGLPVGLFFSVFRPLGGMPRQPRYAGRGDLKQAMFRDNLLFCPFLMLGGEQSDPKEGCSLDGRNAAPPFCCFGPEEYDPWSWSACVQVCVLTAPSVSAPAADATRPSPQDLGEKIK